MSKVKIDGSWKTITSIYHKVSGEWKTVLSGYSKIDGQWKTIITKDVIEEEGVPSNAIILYDANDNVPADSSVYTDGNERFIMGTTSDIEDTLGVETHSGEDHGNAYTYYSGHSHTGRGTSFMGSYVGTPLDIHAHTYIHTHDSVENIVPSYVDFIPTTGAKKIHEGAVFMTMDIINESFWDIIDSAVERYIRMVNSQTSIGQGGNNDHNHAQVQGTVSGNLTTSSYPDWGSTTTWVNPHSHTATSNMIKADNEPPYFDCVGYKVNKEMDWENLPSGTICLFTDDNIPTGWTQLALSDNRIPRMKDSTPLGTGGSATHTHGSDDPSLPTSTGTSVQGCGRQTEPNHYIVFNHTHTVTVAGIHTGEGTSIPPSIKLYIAEKD